MRNANRLPALEAAFVGLETEGAPFAFSSILELDRPIAVDALRDRIDQALAGLPRYRQRLDRARRAWADDPSFQIGDHVLAITVAAPGGSTELEALAAQLAASDLPPQHAPWCVWTVSGLAGGRGAVITLIHHALADGIAGFRLLEHVLGAAPAAPPAAAPPTRLATLRRLLAWRNVRALRRLLVDGLRPAAQLGINPRRTGRARAVASHTVALGDVKAIERAFGATNNDIVLAVVTLALRRFVARRGLHPDRIRDVRAMVPVSRHGSGDRATSGNRVVLLLVPLPLQEADPVECLLRVATTTRHHKADHTAAGGDLLVALGDATTPAVLLDVLRVALWLRAFNVLVTNVPGPPAPLSLLGARVTRIVPIVNLWPHQALGIAIASYAGTIFRSTGP